MNFSFIFPGALSPSHFSSPNLLFQSEKNSSRRSFEFMQLPDTDICQIMSFLDGKFLKQDFKKI